MASLLYALFGSSKSETAPLPSSESTPVMDPPSDTDLAAKHDAMMSALAAKKVLPVPQKSLKRKHSATIDLYGKVVQIKVGDYEVDASSARIFEIHGGLLCKHSGYFRKALDNDPEQEERRRFQFPDHEPEIFRYFTLWMYENKLYRADQTGPGNEDNSPAKTIKPDVDLSEPAVADQGFDLWSDRDFNSDSDHEPPQKRLRQDICFRESTDAKEGSNLPSKHGSVEDQQPTHDNIKQDPFDSDLTIIGDELSSPIVLSDDEDEDITSLIPQYDEVKDVAHKDNSPPPPKAVAGAKEDAEPAQPTRVFKTDTTSRPPPPTVPLDTLILTKLYILAETLDMPALCNHVMALISQRLPHDQKIVMQALIYAFERSKRDSYICRVLIDYTARYACIDEVLGNAETGELSRELLVDLLSELGELRGNVGEWDEVGDVRMYQLPVRRF